MPKYLKILAIMMNYHKILWTYRQKITGFSENSANFRKQQFGKFAEILRNAAQNLQ